MLTEQQLIEKGFHNRNYITGRFYLGEKNQIILNEAGFTNTEWMTFLQIKQNGYRLKKGSQGIEVTHIEPIEIDKVDENGNTYTENSVHITKHILFNIEQTEKVSDNKKQNNDNIFNKDKPNKYINNMITQKQRLLLIKLIKSHYEDERTKAGLLNRINELSKREAKEAIKKMLQETV